ncbi:MAG TPA: sodium/solute symporter [Vicinamibacterales bacterium]|jgi:SSS family transporter|nr:sodium/solute symporter [Vicinamibacterales bacterium]
MNTSIHAIDAAILVAYLIMLTGVGLYFSRRQVNLDEFFRARQSMTWLPVGLSLMAALDSAIDYLMQPSSTIKYGLILLVGTSSWLLLYPWVAKVTLPFYRRLNLYTTYEYLEARFDVRVRSLAAGIFIVWRLGWMATAIYVPCLAISAATGGGIPLTGTIVALGVVVTFYTALGGVQAVIWNDVAQFMVRFGGLTAVVVIAARAVPGGLSEIWQVASAAGKTTLFAPIAGSSDGLFAGVQAFFEQPLNVVSIMFALMVGRMAAYVGDQIMVQRLQTTRSLKDARRAFVVTAAGDIIWMFALSFVGLALFAYFQRHPLPPDFSTDKILPYFMSLTFPRGIVGLVIASIMASSLSSVDSAINSCTSVVVVDFYNRLVLGRQTGERGSGADDRRQVLVARVATVGFGALGTLLAINVSRIGSLLEIANKLINAFTGPLFGIYLLAMFSRRATAVPVLIAGVLGSFTSYYVAYRTSIGFMWPSTFGLAATLIAGWVLTVVLRTRPSEAALKLTWWEVVKSEPAAAGQA